MAREKPKPDRHNSFEDSGIGIGQLTDGTFKTFPASELAERTAARDREEAAQAAAVQQSEDDDEADSADLDEMEKIAEEVSDDGA